MGKAMMGTGEAEGENRAIRAAEAAISNPLLEDTSMAGARGLLINITGGDDLTLFEVDQAANRIREEVDEEANIIFGSAVDENLSGRIRVSVVATGIDSPQAEAARPRLVAVGGGAMPAPLPVPVPAAQPAMAAAMQAAPQAAPAPVVMAQPLRQASGQPHAVAPQFEPAMSVAEAAPAPFSVAPVALHAVPQPQPAPRVAPQPVGRGLFAEAPRPTAAPAVPQPTAEPARPSLFTTVTGAFRRRAGAPPMGEVPARQEPVMQPHPEPVRPSVRPATTDDAALDIPAFLRRQSS